MNLASLLGIGRSWRTKDLDSQEQKQTSQSWGRAHQHSIPIGFLNPSTSLCFIVRRTRGMSCGAERRQLDAVVGQSAIIQ
jgi:hypothetical protein